jgi:DNA-binding transcriptional LysR family regulator
MDRLGSMSILVAAVEAGSLSAAARVLDTPLSTVSRKISDLEGHLKAQLLTRSSRRLNLTEAGKSYVAACKRILEDVSEAERIATGEYTVPKGELSLSAPTVFGRLHLMPVLGDFIRAYPDIDVRLMLSNRQVNLTEEGIDAALRVGSLPDSELIATRVGAIRRVFAASPSYLSVRGNPQKPADLAGHDFIGVLGFTGPGFWNVTDDVGNPRRYRLIVNSTDAACEAAREGIGIVSVFSHHVASDLRAGRLVSVLPSITGKTLPLSFVRASGEYLPTKLRVFLDFVTPRLRPRLSLDL